MASAGATARVECPSLMPFNRDNYGIDVNFMNLIVGIVLYANLT